MEANLGLSFWLTAWNTAPSLYVGTALIVGFYLYAVGPLRKKYALADSVRRSQVGIFLLGMAVIFLALVTPLDELGDEYLFSAHMVQHLLITVVGPPLLLIGTPEWLIEPVLRQPLLFKLAKFLTFPIVAFFLFNADFWLWHAPALYNATLENEYIHILEHLTFLVFSVIYWWPVFSPSKDLLPRLSLGGQVLYIFISGMPVVLLGAGLTFTPPLYAPYIQQPVRAWGISPTLDQQLGGLIMWIPGNILNICIVSFLFINWMRRQEEKQSQEEAARYALEDVESEEEEPSDTAEQLP